MLGPTVKFFSVSLIVFAPFISTAYADDITLKFEDVSTVAEDGDLSICDKRYGDGYKTSVTDKGPRHRVTDNGHSFEIVKTEVFEGAGTVTFHNTYKVDFADGSTAVDAEVWASGLAGSHKFAGTFTDGTCRGHVVFSR